jgi:hypothetical protein
MKTPEMMEAVPGRDADATTTHDPGVEITSERAAESKRKAEFRSAIEASTARIMSIALTRGPDLDPEAA